MRAAFRPVDANFLARVENEIKTFKFFCEVSKIRHQKKKWHVLQSGFEIIAEKIQS